MTGAPPPATPASKASPGSPGSPPSSSQRRAAAGTVAILLGEAVVLPAALVVTALLTRVLGPGDFGRFALAAAIVGQLEWTIAAVLSRPALRQLAAAEDWRPAGATLTAASLAIGLVAGALVALAAGPIAALLDAPAVATPLRWLALDLPLFCVASAHRTIVFGVGSYAARAWLNVARWGARAALTAALLAAGFGIGGAIAAWIAASVAELALARRSVRPRWRVDPRAPLGALVAVAAPLVVFALGMRALEKLDLLLLSAFGAPASAAGWFGAAQTLAAVPGMFAGGLSALLLTEVVRRRREEDEESARTLATGALRLLVALAPVVAVGAGAAPALVRAVFGAAFAPAAPVLAWLLGAAMATAALWVASAVLVARDRPRQAVLALAPTLALAVPAYAVVVPRLGMTGAAAATAALMTLAGALSLVAVWRDWRVAPPIGTVLRAMVLTPAGWIAARALPPAGVAALAGAAGLALLVPVAFGLLGELGAAERRWLRDRLAARQRSRASSRAS